MLAKFLVVDGPMSEKNLICFQIYQIIHKFIPSAVTAAQLSLYDLVPIVNIFTVQITKLSPRLD